MIQQSYGLAPSGVHNWSNIYHSVVTFNKSKVHFTGNILWKFVMFTRYQAFCKKIMGLNPALVAGNIYHFSVKNCQYLVISTSGIEMMTLLLVILQYIKQNRTRMVLMVVIELVLRLVFKPVLRLALLLVLWFAIKLVLRLVLNIVLRLVLRICLWKGDGQTFISCKFWNGS